MSGNRFLTECLHVPFGKKKISRLAEAILSGGIEVVQSDVMRTCKLSICAQSDYTGRHLHSVLTKLGSRIKIAGTTYTNDFDVVLLELPFVSLRAPPLHLISLC